MKSDFEKDVFIKDAFKKDELISRKADVVFNNVKNLEMVTKDNEKELNNKKSKISKLQKIISIAACTVIVFGGANIYATTQGYENIFFMIKDKVIDISK